MALKNLYYLNKTNHHDITEVWLKLVFNTNAGADPGFQVKGAHLKKMRRAEGGAKYFVTARCYVYHDMVILFMYDIN